MNILKYKRLFRFFALTFFLVPFVIPSPKSYALEPIHFSETSFEKSDLYLMTVGLGSSIEARYGHTLVYAHEPTSGEEHTLNWGTFSFSADLPLQFFLGKLRYWLSDDDLRGYLYFHQHITVRPVWQNTLNLSPEQKQRFYTKMSPWFEAENRFFWYHHFFENCATIPRDLLDAALEGALSARFKQEMSGKTFRWYVLTHLNRPPVVAFFLDLIMNDEIDRETSKWEEMFYPLKLREHLMDFTNPALNKPLLTDSLTLVDLPNVPSSSIWLYHWIGIGFALSLLLLFYVKRQHLQLLRRLFIVLLCICGGFASLLSTVMVLSWIFSGHTVLYHNACLFFFWPTDVLYLIFAFGLYRSSHLIALHTLKIYLVLHLAVAALGLLLWGLGYVHQDISRAVLYLVPMSLIVPLLALREEI